MQTRDLILRPEEQQRGEDHQPDERPSPLVAACWRDGIAAAERRGSTRGAPARAARRVTRCTECPGAVAES